MTFSEFQRMRKRVTAAEMERAGVRPNEQTQYGWLYPGGLFIESTEGWNDEWMGMFYLLVDGQEYFKDDLEELERNPVRAVQRWARSFNHKSIKQAARCLWPFGQTEESIQGEEAARELLARLAMR